MPDYDNHLIGENQELLNKYYNTVEGKIELLQKTVDALVNFIGDKDCIEHPRWANNRHPDDKCYCKRCSPGLMEYEVIGKVPDLD